MRKIDVAIMFGFIITLIVLPLIIFPAVDKRMNQLDYCDGIRETKREYKCCVDCHKFDYDYLNYEWHTPGFIRPSLEDCYCKDGNESIQIY